MPIKILHIEDEKGSAVIVDDICRDHEEDIVTEWINNFEDGIEKLRQNPFSFNGIILDAKCFLNADKEALDEQYITKAIFEIEKIFREFRVSIPYCILSGFKERIEGFIEAHMIEAYDKDGQEKEAVKYIVKEQGNVTRYQFDQDFPDLLPLTELGYLNSNDASVLLQLYKAEKMRTKNKALIKNQIAQARPILERIFLILNRIGNYQGDPIIPNNYIQQNGTDPEVTHVTNCAKYLSGMTIEINDNEISREAVMPRNISWQCSAIYNIASSAGNHTDDYHGTRNTLSSVFYSLIDVLYWYRGFIMKIQTER